MRDNMVAKVPAAAGLLAYSVISGMRGGWRVVKNGHRRALASYELKRDAVKHAREATRKEGGALSIHYENGMVERLQFYGDGKRLNRRKP